MAFFTMTESALVSIWAGDNEGTLVVGVVVNILPVHLLQGRCGDHYALLGVVDETSTTCPYPPP